jgi:hypothetical protein
MFIECISICYTSGTPPGWPWASSAIAGGSSDGWELAWRRRVYRQSAGVIPRPFRTRYLGRCILGFEGSETASEPDSFSALKAALVKRRNDSDNPHLSTLKYIINALGLGVPIIL